MRLLFALLGPRNPFRRWGFMLQSEVAARLLAAPDEPAYGTLSVWARLFSQARPALRLGPDAFVPRPRVHSTFVLFDPASEVPEIASLPVLRGVVRDAFRYRRKMLRRALRAQHPEIEAVLEAAGIDPERRGETLSEAEFVGLANTLAARERAG